MEYKIQYGGMNNVKAPGGCCYVYVGGIHCSFILHG